MFGMYYDLKPEFFFLALKNIHFLRVLGKSSRNNARLIILSNTPSWYFLQYHQRYLLQYATHTTHVSTPPTLPTLAHHHVTHAGTQPTLARHPCQHVTHASVPPTQTYHPGQQAFHASTPLATPTQAQIARRFSDPWVSS